MRHWCCQYLSDIICNSLKVSMITIHSVYSNKRSKRQYNAAARYCCGGPDVKDLTRAKSFNNNNSHSDSDLEERKGNSFHSDNTARRCSILPRARSSSGKGEEYSCGGLATSGRGASSRSFISQTNSNNNPIMLSPPSSSISDGEFDVARDNLFPELEDYFDFKNELPFSANSNFEKGHENDSDSRNVNSGPTATSPQAAVVRVSMSRITPKAEPCSSTNYSVIHHNYASQVRNHSTTQGVRMLPKYTEFEPETGFEVCGPMSKNAVLARENRRKKKEYVVNMENQISTLQDEKTVISNTLYKANSTIAGLKDEIEYLKSVIANETTLGALLKNIPQAAGISIKRGRSASMISTSDIKIKRHKADDDYNLSSTKPRPGVCLHVAEGSVSLEFCNNCNTQSQKTN